MDEKNNKSKGFANITVPIHIADELIKLRGIELYGRQLVITRQNAHDGKVNNDVPNYGVEVNHVINDSVLSFDDRDTNESSDQIGPTIEIHEDGECQNEQELNQETKYEEDYTGKIVRRSIRTFVIKKIIKRDHMNHKE